MADVSNITKIDKSFLADDGEKRGPMTMVRLGFHPKKRQLVAQIVDRRLACFSLDAEVSERPKVKGKHVFGELVCPHRIGWVRAFAIHPQGEAVITGGSDRTLRRWAWTDDRPATEPSHQCAAHEGWVEGIAYSPDGKRVVSVGADRHAKVWDSADLKPIKSLSGHVNHVMDVAFTHDGQQFVTGGEDGKVIVWDAKSFEQVATIDFGGTNKQFGQTPRQSGIHRLAISCDDQWLAIAGGEALHVYNLPALTLVAIEKCDMDVAFHPSAALLSAGESEVKCWAYDAQKLVPPRLDKAGKPNKANTISGKLLSTLKRGDWSLGIAFSVDGRQLALGKSDGTVELYNLA